MAHDEVHHLLPVRALHPDEQRSGVRSLLEACCATDADLAHEGDVVNVELIIFVILVWFLWEYHKRNPPR